MNFNQSVKYLYSLGNEVSAMKLGLENIRILLNALGNPEKKYLKVQVAGTNGKGSTCAFLESICLQANVKVGMTTSPHLVSITERVRINSEEISEEDFARFATKIREISEKLVAENRLENVPTFFEQVTAIALFAFAEKGCELTILETGLGGRFDATTAANAEIVAVTPIDFDHQSILGNTLEKIASEKAAIIRADTKAVISAQPKEALQVILEKCASENVSPKLSEDVKAETENAKINFKTETAEYKNVRLNLLGKHQIENAKTAILLAETLQEYFTIAPKNIIEGLQTAKHKGRLEFVGKFLFDGAHNVAGAKALREFLDTSISQKITMIFGAMRDKNLTEIAGIIFPQAQNLILTVPENPRSMPIFELKNFVPQNFKGKIFEAETVVEAIEKATEISLEDEIILVTGSLYLVGEAQKVLKK